MFRQSYTEYRKINSSIMKSTSKAADNNSLGYNTVSFLFRNSNLKENLVRTELFRFASFDYLPIRLNQLCLCRQIFRNHWLELNDIVNVVAYLTSKRPYHWSRAINYYILLNFYNLPSILKLKTFLEWTIMSNHCVS